MRAWDRVTHALRRGASGRVLAGAVVAASAAMLLVDAARVDQQRIDDLHRDLAVASLHVGEDTLRPQLALRELASDMDTILAAINGRSEHFSASFERLQELFPDARALHAATSPGNTVALVGEPALHAPFEAAELRSFCAEGKGYSVVSTGIGPRGWISLALDPERSLQRVRAAAGQPVHLALIQPGSADVLADDRGSGCRPLGEPAYRQAAAGGYGVTLVALPAGTTAVGYTQVVGTPLSVIVEDDPAYRETAAWERRATVVGLGALVLAAGHLAWRMRRRREAPLG